MLQSEGTQRMNRASRSPATSFHNNNLINITLEQNTVWMYVYIYFKCLRVRVHRLPLDIYFCN